MYQQRREGQVEIRSDTSFGVLNDGIQVCESLLLFKNSALTKVQLEMLMNTKENAIFAWRIDV